MTDCRRVVWLSINSSFSHASLALPLLHSACGKRFADLAWFEVEGTAASPIASRVEHIVSLRPSLLLATCYLFNRETVLRICRRVKAVLPETVVILGGPEFLGPNRKFLELTPAVDFLVRGEGEAVLPELLDRIFRGRTADGISGVAYRDENGSVHDPTTAGRVLPFAQLPLPIRSPFFKTDRPFVQLEASRGCQGSCAFCTSGNSRLRLGSLARLAENLCELRDRGVREIRLLDRTFNSAPERTVQLLTLFRRKFSDIRFHIEVHPGFLDTDVRHSLRQAPAGQLHIEAGIQSGDPAVLKTTERAANSKATWDGIGFLAGAGNLDVHVDLLAGLPRQSLDSVYADLSRAISLGVEEVQVEIVKILPGTPMAEKTTSYGLMFAPDPPYEVLATETMSVQDLENVRKLSILVDRFHNAAELRTSFATAVKADGVAFLRKVLSYVDRIADLDQPMSLNSRMKLLHGYAQESGNTRLRENIQYAWIRYGMSPQHGLVKATLWTEPVPEDAVRIEGSICDTATRIWQAYIGRKNLLFLFDRHKPRRPACAVFCLSNDSVGTTRLND